MNRPLMNNVVEVPTTQDPTAVRCAVWADAADVMDVGAGHPDLTPEDREAFRRLAVRFRLASGEPALLRSLPR